MAALPISKDKALSRLEDSYPSSASKKILSYPKHIQNEEAGLSHYMVFTIFESVGTQLEALSREIDSKLTPATSTLVAGIPLPNSIVTQYDPDNQVTIAREGILQLGGTQAKFFKNLLSEDTGIRGKTEESKDMIVLYIPPKLTSAYNITWNQDSMRSATLFKDITKLIMNPGQASGGLAADIVRDFTIEPITKSLDSIAGLVSIDSNFNEIFQLGTRSIANPYMHMMFKQVEPRQFSFDFHFTPHSQAEAESIYEIIKTFKKHSLPKITAGGKGRYWIYPSEFEIKFFSKQGQENKYLSKYKRCVCTAINVDYGGHNPLAFYENIEGSGAPPINILMSISFTEITTLTSDDIEEGY